MTLTQLRYLVAIADSGLNITLAAERVHATQPGLSKQLKQLEDELGFQLFVRKGRSLEGIAPAGERVIEHARRILAEAANIRSYAAAQGYGDGDAAATVVIARNDDGRYVVQAGNRVEPGDGQALVERIRALSGLDKGQLKTLYKEQLRKPRESLTSGAGLGLIDMARKASMPISASLSQTTEGQTFVSLSVVV